MTDKNSANISGNTETQSSKFFGLFICAIGWAFLVAAFWAHYNWLHPFERVDLWAVMQPAVMTAVAIGAFFHALYGTLPRIRAGRFAVLDRLGGATLVMRLYLMLLACIAAYFAVQFFVPTEVEPDSRAAIFSDSLFALAVPLVSPSDGELAQTATMFWSIPEIEEPSNDGLLEMVLAGLLTVIFGLIYPKIERDKSDHDKSFLHKYVMPLVGTLLFGVGASEQVEAEERRADLRLVSHNLPPVISLPDGQRRTYMLYESELNVATRTQLQYSIEQLQYDIDNISSTPGDIIASMSPEDRAALVEGLQRTRETLRLGQDITRREARQQSRMLREQLRASFADNADVLEELGQSISDGNNGLGTAIAGLGETQQQSACSMIRSQLLNNRDQLAAILSIIEEGDERASRNMLERIWVGIKGEDEGALEARRSSLPRAENSQEQLTSIFETCNFRPAGEIDI